MPLRLDERPAAAGQALAIARAQPQPRNSRVAGMVRYPLKVQRCRRPYLPQRGIGQATPPRQRRSRTDASARSAADEDVLVRARVRRWTCRCSGRILTLFDRLPWPRLIRSFGGFSRAMPRSVGRCCVTSSTPRRSRSRPNEPGWNTRDGVLGCSGLGHLTGCGATGPASRILRRSQLRPRTRSLPVSHHRRFRRPTRPRTLEGIGASRGPRPTQSCSTCATWGYPRTVR